MNRKRSTAKGHRTPKKQVTLSAKKAAEPVDDYDVFEKVDKYFSNDDIPEMPSELPPLIKLLTSRTPDIYKPTVAHAVFPSLAAHLHKVRFTYIDHAEHEATLMNVVMAPTGTGKSCINEPIRHIMADIRKRDAVNLKREKEWKDEINTKGDNADKSLRPKGLVIQEISPDITNAAFVMRMEEADSHFLYTKMNEIELFDSLKGSCRGNQQFQIMCLAFDTDNQYGQTRVGTKSVTGRVTVRFNWNASTTINKGRRYFRNVLTSGPINRINFCTIPEQEIGADMPVFGEYDASFDKELKPYIDNLCKASGKVECPEATLLARRLLQECSNISVLSQNRVYENFTFRALVIAWLKACVLYVANGEKWDPTFDEFIRWSLHYDLWCKMEFFAAPIIYAEQMEETERHNVRGPRNLLDMLPDEFTLKDAMRARETVGKSARGTKNMLKQWHYRNYIYYTDNDSYIKNPDYKLDIRY